MHSSAGPLARSTSAPPQLVCCVLVCLLADFVCGVQLPSDEGQTGLLPNGEAEISPEDVMRRTPEYYAYYYQQVCLFCVLLCC